MHKSDVALLFVLLALPASAAALADPCGLTRLPPPVRADGLGLGSAVNQEGGEPASWESSAYKAALQEWLAARDGIAKANNDVINKHPEDLKRRILAESERRVSEVTAPNDLLAKQAELARVCGEVIQLRIDLTTSARWRTNLIAVLDAESESMRERATLSVERRRALYNAETDRLTAASTNPQAGLTLVSTDLAQAVGQRDHLKALRLIR